MTSLKLKAIDLTLTSDDFVEQINQIHNSEFSDYEKRLALVEIGLHNNDLRNLFGGRYWAALKPLTIDALGMPITFGVEIECIVRRQRIEQAAALNGVDILYEHYNHDDGKVYYKFVTDSSVRADNSADRGDEIECVSPVLNYAADGLESLKKTCKALNEAGAKVNKSTGLHVHIGAQDLDGESIVRVYKNYQMLEDLIDSFMAPSRRASQWCASIRNFNFDTCHDADSVCSKMGGRYYKVNPVAYRRHRTIEFRQHQGSTSYEKISMWVAFCAKLVAYSKGHTIESPVTNINQVPFLSTKEKRFFAARVSEFASR